MTQFKIQKKDWKSIPIKSISFILSEAKDYLDYTITESNKITNRAYSIVLFLFAVLSAIAGYTFNKFIENGIHKIVILNFILIVVLSFGIIILGTLVFPRKIMAKGRIPKTLALPDFLNTPKFNKDENFLLFIIQEVENVQYKIDYNLIINKERQFKLKVIMISLSVIFPLYLIISFFTLI